jgi:hypothetical protein
MGVTTVRRYAFVGFLALMSVIPPMYSASAQQFVLNNLNYEVFRGLTPLGFGTDGKLTITDVREVNPNTVSLDGIIRFTNPETGTKEEQTFSNVQASVVPAPTAAAGGSPLEPQQAPRRCPILFLDIQPIFLDVLGLTVSLSRIVLDVTAVSGQGKLLGNLLCSLLGIIPPP